MIALALHILKSSLNDYLKSSLQVSDDAVTVSPLLEEELTKNQKNSLLMSVVHVEVDTNRKSNNSFRPTGGGIAKFTPPVHLNLYVLVGANFKPEQYQEGLHWLSEAIGFFQNQPLFTSQNTPNMPHELEKLSIELVDNNVHEQSHYWGALSGKYIPSVIYKVKQVVITQNNMKAILPRIKEALPNLSKN